MNRSDNLAVRLATLFASPAGTDPRFKLVTGPSTVIVEETAKDGIARILCSFGEGVQVIQWRLQTGDLRLIASEKNADGAILVVLPDGAFEAHVMECKQKVDASTWRKALQQLEWTVIRLLAISGALHGHVGRVVLYTAFHTNALAPDQSVDPALLELPLEGEDSVAARRELPMVHSDVETNVELPGWASPFLHVKVPKDAQGHATVALRVGAGPR